MRFRQYRAQILLMLLSPVAFLFVAEVATRLLWDSEQAAPRAGVIPTENGRDIVHEDIEYRVNSLGIRDREPSAIQTDEVILALGDSFLWGDGLPADAVVTTKVEALLVAGGRDVSVINAGISGSNTRDQHEQLERLEPVYRPDHVMVFFFTNDVLQQTAVTMRGGRVENQYSSFRQKLKEALRNNSRFMAWLYFLYKSQIAERVGVPQSLLPPDYFDLDDTKPGWLDFKTALADIRRFCDERGMSYQLVIIPTLTTLNENYPYRELHGKVKGYAAEIGMPVVDLLPVFSSYMPLELWVSPRNTHWNDFATSLAAEAIVEKYNLLVEEQ